MYKNTLTIKLNNIAIMKTIMMIAVVLCHSCAFFCEGWFEYVKPFYKSINIGKFSDWLGTFHIQTFTMASGFLFYYMKFEKNKYNDWKNDIRKRFIRLMIPYFFTSLLWVVPFYGYFYGFNIKNIITNYIFMKAPSQLWFLVMLFLVFLCFYFISNKTKISFKNFAFIYVIGVLGYYTLAHFGIKYFQLDRVCLYSVYFYLGGILYKYGYRLNIKNIILMFFMCCLLYYSINGGVLKILNNQFIHYGLMIVEPVISILEVCIIYYLGTWLVNSNKFNVENKLYKSLEENSFGIYLFHQQIIYVTILIFNGRVLPICQVMLSFIISLMVSLFMSLVLKKNKYTKFIFGL